MAVEGLSLRACTLRFPFSGAAKPPLEGEGAADGGGEVGGVGDVLVEDGGVAEFGDEGGGVLAGESGEGVGGGEVIGGCFAGDGAQDGDGEFPGGWRR